MFDSIPSLKLGLKEILSSLEGEDRNYDDLETEEIGGWLSIIDEIEIEDSFQDIADIVYGFSSGTDVVFRFSEVEFGEEIELIA